MANMNQRQVLRTAIKRIERYGWRQNDWGNSKEGYCIWGAICMHYPEDQAKHEFWQRLAGKLEDMTGECITSWNDWPGRTQDDVLELLRKAAR